MIQGGQDVRLSLETRQTSLVADEVLGQDLDRDIAFQLGVRRAVDLTHASRTERRGDLVRAELRAGLQSHDRPSKHVGASARARPMPQQGSLGYLLDRGLPLLLRMCGRVRSASVSTS